MKKRRFLNRSVRIALFVVILFAGTTMSLLIDETESLASVDLSDASIETMAVTTDESVLYAAFTNGPQPTGISRSDDFGQTWQIVGPGPGGMAITDLAVHPYNTSLLFAGSSRNDVDPTEGLWASADGGQTWHKYPVALPTGVDGLTPKITALAIDPKQPTVLYIGTDGKGAYRYETGIGGFGYDLIGNPAESDLHVKDMVIDSDGLVYILSTEGLFVTDGTSWQALDTLPDGVASLAIDPQVPQTLYAGTVGYGAFRSDDGGQTWAAINAGLGWQPGVILRVSAIDIDVENPQHLALATAMSVGSRTIGVGVYESFDAGQIWYKVAETRDIITDLTLTENGLFVATRQGVVRYGDPLPSVVQPSPFNLRALASPSGAQILVIVLTLALAVLALLGQSTWLPRYDQTPA